jgi:hypothetical protein
MSVAANSLQPRVKETRVGVHQIIVEIMDGRTISVPLDHTQEIQFCISIPWKISCVTSLQLL